jgi:ribose-phosphate pyrophosphokinase
VVESVTIEQTLPGLEGREHTPTAPLLAVGRAVSLTPQKRLAVVAGSSHPLLAARIAGHLGVELTKVEHSTFADGSPYFRFEDSVRGADMFIVQTAAPSIGEHLMELLIMVNAAKLASAKRITAVIPWFFYARQDKKSRPREPITARLVADLLETAGVDRVITMDLHAGQVQGFFRIPVDHMVAVPMFAQHIRDYLGTEVERVAVAPDTGRAKLAGKFAEMIGGGLVVLNKERPGHNQAKVTGVIGDVAGKVAVMTDDIIDTAGTLCAGAEALREAGATRVIACATHALFNDPALARIADSAFEKVVVTDTVPVDELSKPANVEVLSISGLLAETIQNVFSDDSVSAIFAGENQLF